MATGFGTNAWIGFAEESTYGTYVPATKFIEITEESFKLDQSWMAKPTLRSASQDQRVKSKRSISGGFKANLGYAGFERLFKHALGTNLTTGGAPPYTHTVSLATALPTGLSFHVNRDASSVGTAFKYEGCQISKFTLRQAVEEIASIEVEVVGEDSATLAVETPTFPTFDQVDWEVFQPMSFNGNAFIPSEFELTVENTLAQDRFFLGSRTRRGLGRNGPRKITGKATGEFITTSLYALYDALNTPFTLTASWDTGAGRSLVILAKAVITNADVSVSDSGPIQATYEFECFQASAPNDELTITFTNSSATI